MLFILFFKLQLILFVELVVAIFCFTQVSFAEIVFEQLGEINICNMFKKQRFQGVKLVWVCVTCVKLECPIM
jgi:hypothetical protein